MDKPCFPPLFPPGFHDLDENKIKLLCVDVFPNSVRRSILYCNYIQLMTNIRSINMQFKCFVEVWVDGSFTTEKPEPDDIDMLLVIDYDQLNLVPPMFQPQVERLLDRPYIKHNYSIDLLLLRNGQGEDRMHWRGVFGHDREDTPKGIVRVPV
ncbi:hypothetical protein AWY96_05175 [Serratia plymuthica]|uniref:DUF6932 family protein n=1 Tax=Serratia plymuthica TaxID=82996 RepID=UPI0007A0AFD5|nr:hypothetical protein [Serratia plymuthica]KYQ97925.1 hypothetical protein AWY96_05175 [Serratia plymuthica]